MGVLKGLKDALLYYKYVPLGDLKFKPNSFNESQIVHGPSHMVSKKSKYIKLSLEQPDRKGLVTHLFSPASNTVWSVEAMYGDGCYLW